jgi:hypothetical protein
VLVGLGKKSRQFKLAFTAALANKLKNGAKAKNS